MRGPGVRSFWTQLLRACQSISTETFKSVRQDGKRRSDDYGAGVAGGSFRGDGIDCAEPQTARRVPEHTQLRIRELAEQLSYRPSHFAQAMKNRSTGIYGFVCGDVGTPFYAELTECLMREADRRGCRLMTMPTEWDVGREIRTLETLLTRMVDGVVMC